MTWQSRESNERQVRRRQARRHRRDIRRCESEVTYNVKLGKLLQGVLCDRAGRVLLDELVALLIKELERAEDLADLALGRLETPLDVLEGRQRKEGDVGRRRAAGAQDRHTGDDAERSLRADEELLEVRTGVVLAQTGLTAVVNDLALDGNDLEAED